MKYFTKAFFPFIFLFLSANSHALTSTEAAKALRPAAAVMGESHYLNRSLLFCSEMHPEIKQQMDAGYKHWLAANDDVIRKSRFVYQFVLDDIRKDGGEKMTKDFDADNHKTMDKMADLIISKFRKDYSRNFDQICLKMVDEIRNGKRDIKTTKPADYQQLLNIKTD